MRHLAILGSTRGTALLGILDAIHTKKVDAKITIVVSDKQDAGILERAASHHLLTEFVDPKGLTREEYDIKVSALLKVHQVDLVVLIGYMRILSKTFIDAWRNQIINVHPSLLPAFKGLMDKKVHQAVLDSGITETGCTVHYVTEDVDAGPILIQKRCPVLATDTIETLKARVQLLENEAIIEGINACL
jgi:phosphoribosylglycinamide formyltransferase-1